jgi:hypothetical protein
MLTFVFPIIIFTKSALITHKEAALWRQPLSRSGVIVIIIIIVVVVVVVVVVVMLICCCCGGGSAGEVLITQFKFCVKFVEHNLKL